MSISIGKNQYLVTKLNMGTVDSSRCLTFAGYNVFLGEACKCYIYGGQKGQVCVIGYAVDVANPENTVEQMCMSLLDNCSSMDIGPQCSEEWCGRWIVIVEINGTVYCWGDACGLKQLFYDSVFDTIASQARYIAACKGYKEDKEAKEYLQAAEEFDKEYSWPVDVSLYSEVKRLLPNHVINMSAKSVSRNDLRIPVRNKIDIPKQCADALKNAMCAVSRENKLAVTLTGGWDSRIVLSASKDLNRNYDVVTLRYDWMREDNEDITTAKAVCDALGIEHTVLDCSDVDDEFRKHYVEHSENAHEYWIQMAYAIKKYNYGDWLWVKGSCNEILRVSAGNLYNWQVAPGVLCKLFRIKKTEFALKALSDWLNDAREFCKRNNLKLLDLFYWEHRMGSWMAECANKGDISGEIFTPFNSRIYIVTGLQTQISERAAPQYRLLRSTIKNSDYDDSVAIKTHGGGTVVSRIKQQVKYRIPLVYGILSNL